MNAHPPASAVTMTAYQQDRYGDATVLVARSVPIPEPAPEQVIVRMRGSSVNAGDVRVMRGDPLVVRTAFGLRAPRIAGRGMDVAGEISAIGSAVHGWSIGDRVVAEAPGGAFARWVAVPAQRLVALPPEVDDATAGVLPVAGCTAALAISKADVQEGSRVLVLGASGGVGSFAVQLAALAGATVTAVARAEAVPLASRWGAETVYERGSDPVAPVLQERFDVVIDVSGDQPLRRLQSLLADGGRVAMVAGTGGRVLGPLPRIARAAVLSRRAARLLPIVAAASAPLLAGLVAQVAAGRLRPHISETVPLAAVPRAVAALDRGGVIGKLAVTSA